MDNKELIEIIQSMDRDANTRIRDAAIAYDKAIKFEEGFKEALYCIDRILNRKE